MSNRFEFDSIDAADALDDAEFVADWNSLLGVGGGINRMYASPDWAAHLTATTNDPLRVWRVRDAASETVGILVARLLPYTLQYSVKNRVVAKNRIRAAHILGSMPVLPKDETILGDLIANVFFTWQNCDALYFDALPVESAVAAELQCASFCKPRVFFHLVDGRRPWHLLDLCESFDAYLKTLSPKSRAALRRKARLAGETRHGNVHIRRVTASSDVSTFLKKSVEVSRRSWQHRILGERIRADEMACRTFQDLADRGLLRAYLLELGETPCAFVIGYQFADVYHYAELGFSDEFTDLSPGTVLLFHIVEDLHGFDKPACLNFGVGDASYKQRFGNRQEADMSCLVFRNTYYNRAICIGHAAFTRSIEWVKKRIGRTGAKK